MRACFDGSSFSVSRGRKTASNSSPFARCSVSRWTPRAPSPPGSNRCRRSAEKPAASPSNASASETRRARSVCRTSSRSPSLSGTTGSQPASSAASRTVSPAGAPPFRSILRSRRLAASRTSSEAPWNGSPAPCSSSSKSVRRALVRQRIAISSSAMPPAASRRIWSTSAAPSASGVENGATQGSGPSGERGPQHLLGTAETRHEPVRERQHLRRRAVVLLEPDDQRVREALRDAEQMRRARAGEPVDRLEVVADDAEVITLAEPQVEQGLLEQVDVLVLVDRERPVLRAEGIARAGIALEEVDREREQILEVDHPFRGLARLVVAVDAEHQVVRNRRLAIASGGAVTLGRDAAVLRPLDLGREVARRPELERRRERVRQLAERQRLRREHLADIARREVAQLAERRRVERARPDALHAERLQARLQLARGLLGEGHRHDLVGRECTRRDLLRDPARDRRRLARTGPREDADRAANRLGGPALLGVQTVENVHIATLPTRPEGFRNVSATCLRGPPGCPRAAARGSSGRAR